MQSFQPHLIHLLVNGMTAVSGQLVDAGSDKKVHANVLRTTKQFVDVTFTVANMDATLRVPEKRC